MLKLISSKDVIPHDRPNKVIRNFREYTKRFIFSFLMYKRENDKPGEKESIQIKSNTKGVLKKEIHVKLLRKECSIALQHLYDFTFRLTFYIKVNDNEFSHGLSIDLKLNYPYFQKLFREIDVSAVVGRHPELDRKLFLNNYELVDEEFIRDLKSPVKELENYAKQNYATSLNAFLYGEERSHLITQVRIESDSSTTHDSENEANAAKKELWIVRDDSKNRKWVFVCKTLYKLQISRNKNEEIERTLEVPYSDLWKYFGVEYSY